MGGVSSSGMGLISNAIFRSIRGHLLIGCVWVLLCSAVYWLHTDQLLHPPDLGENIARSLESDMPIAHGIAPDNTTQGLMADLQLYGRTLVTPHFSVLPLQVDNPEVEGKITDHLYGLWAYYLSSVAEERRAKSLWDSARRKGQYFTMVFRKPGMKQTKVTCDATDGANAQICVLGFLPNDNGVSLIDLTQNRLHGTLLQYGPNGGAAHALKQYEHKSGHFPLIFVVEAAFGAELPADATGYAIVRQSYFRGFSLRWYKLVMYAELALGLYTAFCLLRAMFWLFTLGSLHPMWRTLKAAAFKGRKSDPASHGKDASQIAQDIDDQVPTDERLSSLRGHYDAQLGCYVCRTNDSAQPSGYLTDSWAISWPEWSVDPIVRHVADCRIEVERIGETEELGAMLSVKTWQSNYWLWWKRVLMFQFKLDYAEAQEMQRELNRRAGFTQPAIAEAMSQHLKKHGGSKAAKTEVNWPSVLGVTETSSPHEVAIAYKRLALEFHPDKPEALFDIKAKQLTDKRREIQTAFDAAVGPSDSKKTR